MYIPATNNFEDHGEILDFIRRYSFGTIITANKEEPEATHLPFIVDQREDKTFLLAHFARANTHWQRVSDNKALVIFAEPHAYISPASYTSELNVPTWNYIAVHVYGNITILTDMKKCFEVLEATIRNYEEAYKYQWDSLPQDFKTKMAQGIVVFEMEVSKIHAKKKLSQNRSPQEQQQIIDRLSVGDLNEQQIATYMKAN